MCALQNKLQENREQEKNNVTERCEVSQNHTAQIDTIDVENRIKAIEEANWKQWRAWCRRIEKTTERMKKRIKESCCRLIFYDSDCDGDDGVSLCVCDCGAGGNDSNAMATIQISLQISNNCQINSLPLSLFLNPYNIKLVLYSVWNTNKTSEKNARETEKKRKKGKIGVGVLIRCVKNTKSLNWLRMHGDHWCALIKWNICNA